MIAVNSGILSSAQQALTAIMRANSPQEAKSFKEILLMLAGKASDAGRSIQLTVYNYLDTAENYIMQLEREEYAEIASRIAAERFRLDEDTRQLYDSLKNRGMWSDEELRYLESIDEKAVYKIAAFDENGNPIEGKYEYVTGAELKESATILKAYEKRDQLSKEERKALNRKLHGHDGDSVTAEDHKKDMKKLEEAARRVEGHAYATATPEEKQRIADRLKSFLDTTARIREQAARKELLPAGSPMSAPAEAVISGEKAALKENIRAMLADAASISARNKAAAEDKGEEGKTAEEKPAGGKAAADTPGKDKPPLPAMPSMPAITLKPILASTPAATPDTAPATPVVIAKPPVVSVPVAPAIAPVTTPVTTPAPDAKKLPGAPVVKKNEDDLLMEDINDILASEQPATPAKPKPILDSLITLQPSTVTATLLPKPVAPTPVADATKKPAADTAKPAIAYNDVTVSPATNVAPANPVPAMKGNVANMRQA